MTEAFLLRAERVAGKVESGDKILTAKTCSLSLLVDAGVGVALELLTTLFAAISVT